MNNVVRITFGLFLLASAVTAAQDALEVGSRRELFIDTYLIDRMDGVSLRLHEPQPADVALTFDAPWEGRHCGYVTVFQDGDRFRMYYRGLPQSGKDGSDAEVTCYAESTDGVHWTKPELGLFEIDGDEDNNVILAGQAPFSHNFAPFLDTRPGVAPEERYKALAGTSETGLHVFVSGDGLRWRKMQDTPVITEGAFDSQNVAFWSELEGCYVCYYRTWSEGEFAGYRSVSRVTSDDFRAWTAPVEMDYGGTPREHLYTNQTQPYFRAPHLYIATAARFMPGRRVVSDEEGAAFGVSPTYSGDCSDGVLLTSRGGTRYDRTFMEGFIRPGAGLENWTSRTNYPACGIVPTGDHEMSLYVQHHYGQPTHCLMRYLLRTDGFASLRAPYGGGECVTKPFVFSGKELYLNFASSAAGGVRVEVQRADGTPVEGYTLEDSAELIGNFIERAVSWRGNSDASALAGTAIRLRFVMKDADIYALQWR
ncbi:MAG: hypothetical protein KA184_12000 [Candidatus Hydrogenedentes bacterium]|nr:hypothetical protein [Candidatus Hydrogenedentota bacterium]